MKNKIILFLLILILVVGCVQTQLLEKKTITTEKEKKIEKLPLGREKYELFQKYAQTHEKTIQETTTFFTQTYGLQNEKQIFEKLPTPLPNFEEEAKKLYAGNSEELQKINAETYLQPEFYPTFNEIGKKSWTDAPAAFQQVIGLASTPAEQETTIDGNAQEVETTLFIGAAWGATYYQGVGFRYEITPKEANEKIKVKIEPNQIVLGPSFPTFTNNWIQKITIRVQTKEGLKQGTYTIGIYPNNPEEKKEEEWKQKYENYARGNSMVENSNGLAQLKINVK